MKDNIRHIFGEETWQSRHVGNILTAGEFESAIDRCASDNSERPNSIYERLYHHPGLYYVLMDLLNDKPKGWVHQINGGRYGFPVLGTSILFCAHARLGEWSHCRVLACRAYFYRSCKWPMIITSYQDEKRGKKPIESVYPILETTHLKKDFRNEAIGGKFLEAIHDRPEDYETRMIYADWLDDHGMDDRAEHQRNAADFLIKLEKDTRRPK